MTSTPNQAKHQAQPTKSAPVAHQTRQSQLTIFDSMHGEKRQFVPIKAGHVGMYVCGMTVYDYCHIGHGRTVVAFDVIVRWLRELGYEVNYVRNITDIDDKIIARANENNESISSLTKRFIDAMNQDMAALGCMRPDREPRATDYIDEMQQMITKLVDNEYAYAASNGDVYYAVEQFADYGKLSGRKLEQLQAGARIEVEQVKRNPFDFVLWKAAKPDEPQWASAWGQGRPGWHIECSAMSTQCLGATFDIHGGGHDLQFPHHENEIAQSEAATGCNYANYWIHSGFINVDGEKMSKSLGNFFTIREVMARYHPEVIRFFILSSHYRSQVNFSDEALDEAYASLSRLYQALRGAQELLAQDGSMQAYAKNEDDIYATASGQAFAEAMNDDFNTPKALSVLFAIAKSLNKAVTLEDTANVATFSQQLLRLSASLNILQADPNVFFQSGQSGMGTTGDNDAVMSPNNDAYSDADIEQLIQQRVQAKADKDFAQADAIRDELNAHGIELEDGKHGTTWRRKG